VTNEQLYLAIGVPALLNIGLYTLFYLVLSNKIDTFEQIMNAKFDAVNTRITALVDTVNARFDAAHQNLLRVEQVIDARLKHLEEER